MARPWPNVVSMPTHTLLLLRHAKSAYPEGMVDHDRPLAPRGVRQAALAGDWIRANGTNPGAADAISQKFPTSAIAMLRPAGSWADLTLGGAELVTFHVPR